MPAFLLSVIRFVRLLLSGHQAVAIENAALRLQLAAFRRKRKRPVLTFFDRLFWVGLSRVWRNWRGPLLYEPPHPRLVPPWVWFGCAVALEDSPTEDQLALYDFPLGAKGELRFRDCIVKYSGGQIAPIMENAIFENCIFILSLNAAPSQRGQKFSRMLLQSPSASVQLQKPG
jgi:hypothetical protein